PVDHGYCGWSVQHVVPMFDVNDNIHKGNKKRRFCGTSEYRKLIFNALAVNLTTAGIPCIYYGTEQGFDSGGQPSPSDVVLRENMFGGCFGGKCSKGVHFFDEDAAVFKAVSKLCELRHKWLALRRGRQYVPEMSCARD